METERDREILEQLAEFGLEIAAALKAQIVTQAAAGDSEGADRLSLAFTRVSRSIRQTLACKAKLAEKKAKAAAERQAEAHKVAIETSRLRFKKQQAARDVAEMVDAQGASENLLTDLNERLDDPDIEHKLLARPIGEVIFGLCDDLGIPVDRTVFQDKGWFLTEDRRRPGRPRPPSAESLRALTAEALAMMDATTHGPRVPISRSLDDG